MRHRILFSPDDTGNANGGAGGGDAATATANSGASGGDAGAAAATASESGAAGRTFTQEELDSIVSKRVKRAETEAAAKAKADAEKAKLDENERLRVDKQEAEAARDTAYAERDAALIKAEARVQALALGVKPERLEHALRLLDLSDVKIEGGKVPDRAVKEAIALVLADIPELKGEAAGGAQTSGGDFQGGGNGKRVWTRAEIAALAGTPQFEQHKADINAAAAEGRIRG